MPHAVELLAGGGDHPGVIVAAVGDGYTGPEVQVAFTRRVRQPGTTGLDYLQHEPQQTPDCIFSLGSPGDFCEPERMSGGAATGDVDGDGDIDLIVTRLDAPDILYRNVGNGRFEDATAFSGLDGFALHSNGAALADIDNDGDLDLFVTTLGDVGDPVNLRNYLFVNDGHGRFTEDAVARGAAVESDRSRRAFSVAVGDYDLDGYVDFHVTEWLPLVYSHSRLLPNRGIDAPGDGLVFINPSGRFCNQFINGNRHRYGTCC